MVKSLLSTDVPESYVDAYELASNSADNRVSTGISIATAKQLLESTHLDATQQTTILNTVTPDTEGAKDGLGRSEFNVLLALVGLAQEGEEFTLDAVDERRQRKS